MSLSSALEAYRRSTALRLQHDQKDRRIVAESLRARLLQVEKEREAAKEPLRRARQRLPGASICPRCWIERGLQIPLARAGDCPADGLQGTALFRCTAPTCQWELSACE